MMKIPLLDLRSQYNSIKEEITNAINGVLETQSFVLGKEVESLEKEVAAYCNARYAVGVASGTDALMLSLKALGIKEGDEVITTPTTFIATAEAISHVGARPVFVDIDKKSYEIDPGLIERKITKRTKIILPVHIYGQCADMDPILDIAERRGLKVVEDCAQAIGALYKNRRACSMGDTGCLSFFPSKNLGAFGDGGMVVTNDAKLTQRLMLLRVHGSSRRYSHDIIGYNSRLDSLQAAILRVKLKFLDKWIKMRREAAGIYGSLLKDMPIVTPFVPAYNEHTYHLYIIAAPSRNRLLEHLEDNEIETRVYYPIPIHLQECYAGLGYKMGDLPISEWQAENTLAIPIYPELTRDKMETVAGCIKEFFKNQKSKIKMTIQNFKF